MSKILPSSPPMGVNQRIPSPAGSEYSLNLDALDLDARSDVSEPLPQPQVDHIYSEDIDGPSDFTQNMETWMRGGPSKKKTMLVPTTSEQDVPVEYQGRASPSISRTTPGTPAQDTNKVDSSPEEAPKVEEPAADDQFSSEWYPNGQSATPGPTALKNLLQPTVEDYHSETTMGSQTPAPMSRNRSFIMEQSFRKTPYMNQSLRARPSPSPLRQASQPNTQHDTAGDPDEKLRLRMDELQAKYEQLVLANAAMTQTLEDEREVRRQERATHAASATKAAEKERNLTQAMDMARKENDDLKSELENLARHSDENIDHENDKLQWLAEELQRQEAEHIRTTRALQQELDHARRDRDKAETLAKRQREEFTEQRDLLEAETERLRLELKQAREDELAIADLDRQLDAANADVRRLKETGENNETTIKTLREELETTKRSHSDQISRTTEDHIRAVQLASDLQRQVQEVRQQARESAAVKEQESRLQEQLPNPPILETVQPSPIESEIESKQAELNAAIVERDAMQDCLDSAQSELESLRAELVERRSIDAALDARILDIVRQREAKLRAKLDAVKEERDLMAKTLMHQWGREEVGAEKPQRYIYKFPSETKKNGKAEGVKGAT